ncbi:hypothetical protein CRG98_034344, partial [Punica granatum]
MALRSIVRCQQCPAAVIFGRSSGYSNSKAPRLMDPLQLSGVRAVLLSCFLLLPIAVFCSSIKGRRNEVIVARNGAVATDDRRCSRIGNDVLLDGGNAIDASVAAVLWVLLALRQNMYGGNLTLKASGALSIAVPGELAGLHEAWRQYGKLPWKRLVSPAEHLARNGFKISPYLHMQMSTNEDGILADKGLREIFTSNGHLLGVGDICRNRRLAETLKKISQFGIGPLYNGSVGFNL